LLLALREKSKAGIVRERRDGQELKCFGEDEKRSRVCLYRLGASTGHQFGAISNNTH
jgi:hypothetical protein